MTPDEALRLLLKSDRSWPSLPVAGAGGTDSGGTLFGFHPEEWFWANLDAQPDGTTYPGYSWHKVVPRLNGAFADPDPDYETPLKGDNGSGTHEVYNQAFDLNGNQDVAVDTVVAMFRGFQQVEGDDGDFLNPGQQYLFTTGGGGGSGLDRVRVTSGTPATVDSCTYSEGVLLAVGTHPGCNWADSAVVWVTPGPCSKLVNGAEYWVRKVGAVTVPDEDGESRPTYLAVLRADCCDCGDTPDGFSTEYTCTIDLSGTTCVEGVPTLVTNQYCLPFKVAKHSMSAPVDAAACGDTVTLEVPVHPITMDIVDCVATFHYTTKLVTLPASWVATGTTY